MNDYQKELWEKLTRKFPTSIIQTKDTDYMKGQKIIPHQYIIDRLNEVLEFNWDFKIENEEIYNMHCEGGVKGEIAVLGTLTLHIPSSSAPNCLYLARSRSQYGRKELQYNGVNPEVDSFPTQIADDLKAAASTSLVKCASLFGIGLELYFTETEEIDREKKTTTAILEEISYLCKHVLEVNKKELTEFAKKVLKLEGTIDINGLENYQYAALYAHLLKNIKQSKDVNKNGVN